jgi:hypothetical protein
MAALGDLTSRAAVLNAIAEFDEIGRVSFLAKYGFKPARSYFLSYNGGLYDSKAIVGAAHGFQFPAEGPLVAKHFNGGDATVRPKLESLGFVIEIVAANGNPLVFTSDHLIQGEIYPREQLIEMFAIADSTVNNGVFQIKGSNSIWLFITRDKTNDRTQYQDHLDGDLLHWEGQTAGRTDAKIVDHEGNGNELLVFYRDSKRQYPKAGFRYEGPFRYLSHKPGKPSQFLLQRVLPEVEAISTEVGETFDPTDIEDGRKKVLAAVSRRQGQSQFRRALMKAYEGKCAVTSCAIEPLLEAAHIHPYLGPKTNHVTNGMLLRADIHTLFDLGLLAISADHRLLGSDRLLGTEYEVLIGKVIAMPEKADVRPSAKALELHRTQRFETRS